MSLFSHLSHAQMFGEGRKSRRRIGERTGEQRRSKKPPLRKATKRRRKENNMEEKIRR